MPLRFWRYAWPLKTYRGVKIQLLTFMLHHLGPGVLEAGKGSQPHYRWKVDPSQEHLRWRRFDLEPGDVFFLPAGWWHFVASDPRTIMSNVWVYPSGGRDPNNCTAKRKTGVFQKVGAIFGDPKGHKEQTLRKSAWGAAPNKPHQKKLL